MTRQTRDSRFRAVVHRRLEPGETIVATTRLWSSRPSRVPKLAARYRDDVAVTDRRLMVWECGWWTRRARRRVLSVRLADVVATDRSAPRPTGPVTRMQVEHAGRPPVVFDVGTDAAAQQVARVLLTPRAGTTAAPAPPVAAPVAAPSTRAPESAP